MTRNQILAIALVAAACLCVASGVIVALLARATARLQEEQAMRRSEERAIGALRSLRTASPLSRESPEGAEDYAVALGTLTSTALIDGVFGVTFSATRDFNWSLNRGPTKPGDRYFFVDESGVIRFMTSPQAPTGTSGTPGTPIGG